MNTSAARTWSRLLCGVGLLVATLACGCRVGLCSDDVGASCAQKLELPPPVLVTDRINGSNDPADSKIIRSAADGVAHLTFRVVSAGVTTANGERRHGLIGQVRIYDKASQADPIRRIEIAPAVFDYETSWGARSGRRYRVDITADMGHGEYELGLRLGGGESTVGTLR